MTRPRCSLRVILRDTVGAYEVPAAGEISVGRGADIVIAHDNVSRQHLSLRFGAAVEVSDLGSTNETLLFGRPLVPHEWVPVQPGELLVIGGEALVMLHDGDARSVPSRRRAVDDSAPTFDALESDGCVIALCTRVSSGDESGVNWLDVLAGALLEDDELVVLGERQAALVLPGRTAEHVEEVARTLEAHLVRINAPTTIRLRATPASDESSHRDRAEGAHHPFDGARERATMRPQRPVVRDPQMTKIYRLVEDVASTQVNILVLGETGVGKDVVARTLHDRSSRSSGPFVSLNCSALPEHLLESELFGYERGAFTGAVSTKLGLLETADQGTVFLDEIGEMPLATQAKLLRVLEERTVRRVGGLKASPIDIRVVAATHRHLAKEIAEGRFRADLFYRLNGLSIVVPPLRERRSEIAALTDHFLDAAAANLGRPPPVVSDDARAALEAYAWPGNIRELRNVIERLVLLARGGTIATTMLPTEMTGGRPSSPSLEVPAQKSVTTPSPDPSREKAQIIDALAKCSGNQTRAAQMLGITRRVLISRIERYNLPRPRGSRVD